MSPIVGGGHAVVGMSLDHHRHILMLNDEAGLRLQHHAGTGAELDTSRAEENPIPGIKKELLLDRRGNMRTADFREDRCRIHGSGWLGALGLARRPVPTQRFFQDRTAG